MELVVGPTRQAPDQPSALRRQIVALVTGAVAGVRHMIAEGPVAARRITPIETERTHESLTEDQADAGLSGTRRACTCPFSGFGGSGWTG